MPWMTTSRRLLQGFVLLLLVAIASCTGKESDSPTRPELTTLFLSVDPTSIGLFAGTARVTATSSSTGASAVVDITLQ